jgi:glycosyltransferase involved in cell wall biosynthesis
MAKILLHSLVFPPDSVSNAYLFADLATALRDRFGHDIRVLTTTPHYNLVEEELKRQPLLPSSSSWLLQSDFKGITCYHVKVPPKKGNILQRLQTFLRFHYFGLKALAGSGWRPDVVISQSPPLSTGWIGARIAKNFGAKSIYVVQDLFPDGLIKQGRIRNKLLIRAIRILEQSVYRNNSAVTGISDSITGIVRQRAPADTICETIPNFVDADLYTPLPRHSEFSSLNGFDDKFIVSYAGNIGNGQDLTPVLAAAQACADLPVRFVMVGDGIRRAYWEQHSRELGISNLEFPGYRPRAETTLINAASDLTLVIVSPHIGSFGLPSKIYTLMASGKPILFCGDPASDTAKLIQAASCGWAVATTDTTGFIDRIKYLYSHPEELALAGQNGRKAVLGEYTLEHVASRYNNLILRLLQPNTDPDY